MKKSAPSYKAGQFQQF